MTKLFHIAVELIHQPLSLVKIGELLLLMESHRHSRMSTDGQVCSYLTYEVIKTRTFTVGREIHAVCSRAETIDA